MKTKSIKRRICSYLLCLIMTFAPVAAMAGIYDFEIIIFERPGGGANEFWPTEPGEPDPATAVGRLSQAGSSGDATMLPASAKTLGPAAYTLKRKGMVIHDHLAWRQSTRGRNSNTWYSIGDGRLSGLIRMSQGRYLHLDTDLVLRDGLTSQHYRIKLHRRMRSNELHYVDHPRLGILIQAKRLRTAAPVNDAGGDSSGEPKPASPPVPTGQPG
jgi:hypothetical protein